jgi:hypothetical protein
MNVCIGQLINDARDLVLRLKERETNLDSVVVQSNTLAKRVDAIQKVTGNPISSEAKCVPFSLLSFKRKKIESDFVKLNEKANYKSKAAVLSNIQRENRVVK